LEFSFGALFFVGMVHISARAAYPYQIHAVGARCSTRGCWNSDDSEGGENGWYRQGTLCKRAKVLESSVQLYM
jgi:hypothetical protein